MFCTRTTSLFLNWTQLFPVDICMENNWTFHLARHPGTASERDKVALGISVLTGRALEWVHTVWEKDGPEVQSYERFTQLFRAVFDHPTEGQEGASEYALDFRTVAVYTGWNDQALLTVFRSGLQADVQTEPACRNEDLTLDQLIAMAIHLDNLLRARRRPSRGFGSLPGTSSETEPMEVGTTHLPPCGMSTAPSTGSLLLPRGVGPPLEHLSQKVNQARKRQAEERSCTFPVHALDNRPLGTGLECQGRCLSVSICATTVESLDQATHVPIPEEYRDLKGALVTPIIPLSRIVAPVLWNVDADIRRALRQEPSPAHCPEGPELTLQGSSNGHSRDRCSLLVCSEEPLATPKDQ
ncbi:unnamed protein product [Coregonus sp. 'balchen']|nr:unnamed protein product [Coregonus sp. 'balchen']